MVLGAVRKDHEWDDCHGGYVCYMADDEELLTIPLLANSLSMVMRDAGSMRFVKYVNHTAPDSRRDLSAVYSVAADEDGDAPDLPDVFVSFSSASDGEEGNGGEGGGGAGAAGPLQMEDGKWGEIVGMSSKSGAKK